MPKWTKVLDSTTHGEDVEKWCDPNRLEVAPAGRPSFRAERVKPFAHVSLEA
jgi:hypothetical protein